MKILNILTETIPRPPRNLKAFLKNRLKEITELDELANKLDALKEMYGYSPIVDIFDEENLGIDYNTARDMFDNVSSFVGRAKHYLHSGDIKSYIATILDDIDSDDPAASNYIRTHLGYLEKSIGWLEADIDRFNVVDLAILSGKVSIIEKALKNKDYLNPEYADDEDEIDLKNSLNAIKIIVKMGGYIKKVIKARTKLQEIEKNISAHSNGGEVQPEKVEIMYHATTHANDIGKNGFQKTKPEGRRGVGTYYDSDTGVISFTHDLGYAKTITRALRELSMIAHGEINRNQLLRWIESEGISLDDIIQGTDDRNILKSQESIENNAKIYNVYLWHNKIGRENPVFTEIEKTIQMLKSVKVQDIGIVQSEIDMTKPYEYHRAEREWRVSPDSIISTKRVL